MNKGLKFEVIQLKRMTCWTYVTYLVLSKTKHRLHGQQVIVLTGIISKF